MRLRSNQYTLQRLNMARKSIAYNIVTNNTYKAFGLFITKSGMGFLMYNGNVTRLYNSQMNDLGIDSSIHDKATEASSNSIEDLYTYYVNKKTGKVKEVSEEHTLKCKHTQSIVGDYGMFVTPDENKCNYDPNDIILFKIDKGTILETVGELLIHTDMTIEEVQNKILVHV